MKKTFIIFCFLLFSINISFSQQKDSIDINNLTKDEFMKLDLVDLADLPFEDLIKLSSRIGVSANSLLEFLENFKTITASKNSENLFTAPATVIAFNAEQIKFFGWRDLKDVFRALPGVDISYDQQGDLKSLVTFRGILGNNKLLILQDGKRVNAISGEMFIYAHNLPLNIYKRIEILYGPASALYGADAYS